MSPLEKLFSETIFDGNPLADDMGGQGGHVHDWRSYVRPIRDIWSSLSSETRMAVAIVAQTAADSEHWD